MIAHNVGRTPLCILHQICWGVVRAVVVLPTLSLLEQYAVTHRSKLWGRVVARCYALDDGLPPKALRNLDLLALDGALASSNGKSSHHRVVSRQPHDAQTMANRSLTHVQTAKYVSDSTHQTAHEGTESNGYRGAGPSERYLIIPMHT